MAVTEDDVRRIAELARLKPEPEVVRRLTGELNGILEHVRLLEELDVGGLDDMAHATSGAIHERDPELPPDPLAEGAPGDRAPDWREGFFVVPRLPALDGDAPPAGGSA